jgi:hypothetical protein
MVARVEPKHAKPGPEKGEQHRSTHFHREQAFLGQLDEWNGVHGELLADVKQELRQLVARDIELLASSAA